MSKRSAGKKPEKYPETYDGVVVGSIMVAVGLLWYFLPMIWGKILPFPKMLFPWVLFALGILTVVRHKLAGKN